MDNNSFDIIGNLPLIIFSIIFLINFVLFLRAGIILLIAKGDSFKLEKGRRALSNSIAIFILTLIVVGVFYVISFLLVKGKVFEYNYDSEEFPAPAFLESFPSAPLFIDIGKYHFSGPWELNPSERIENQAIIAVLCKNEDNYDTMYINMSSRAIFSEYEQYSCWVDNCNNDLNVAILWLLDLEDEGKTSEILEDLTSKIQTSCN